MSSAIRLLCGVACVALVSFACTSVQPQNIVATATNAFKQDWVKTMNCRASKNVAKDQVCAVGRYSAEIEDAAIGFAKADAQKQLVEFIKASVRSSAGTEMSAGTNKTANVGGATGSVMGIGGGSAQGAIKTESTGTAAQSTVDVSVVSQIDNLAGMEQLDYFWDADKKTAFVVIAVSLDGLRGVITKALTDPAARDRAYKLLGVE